MARPPGRRPHADTEPVWLAADSWAGPRELGRHLLIEADVAAAVPTAWAGAPEVPIDAATLADPSGVIEQLRSATLRRERTVIRLDVPLPAPAETDDRPLHEVGATGVLGLDLLHHLVRSNSVVLGADGRARWPLAERALVLGASLPRANPSTTGPKTGDVLLPDGSAAWLDGGPTTWWPPLDGVPVVPAVALDHGSLQPLGGNESSADLAPDQLAAVTHPGGAARIIAPAGSGKTRVLTERARHLVQRWGLPPGAVTLVAYNKRAQEEMQQRIADVRGLQVRTLNAIALAVLNGTPPFASRPARVATIGEGDVRRLLGQFVQSPRKRHVDPLAPWLAAMSTARLGLRRASEVEAWYDGDVAGLAEVLPQYEHALARQGAVDFDGQITGAIRVLLTDPAARAAAQRACRLLLVDEFQDLTPAHVLLVRLLGGPRAEVFGVGDDDQTIYGYNGADPRWLLEYTSLFPGAGEHPLEVNYRCPADVVEQVDRLLRRNGRRVAKTIRTARSGTTGLTVVPSDDPVATTAGLVQAAIANGRPPGEVAVLSRVNAVLVPVQLALGAAGVPAAKVAGPEFAERTSIRAALAWLRLATSDGRYRSDDLAEALRRPSRGLSPRLSDWAADQRSSAALGRLADRLENERDADKLRQFAADIERLGRVAARADTREVVRVLCDEIELAKTVATLDLNRRGMNAPSQSDDLVALRQLAVMHPEPATFPAWLVGELGRPGDPSGVTLATVHRVKGQEWPEVVVHLTDAEQFPHRLADDTDEERRLFHVAVTRTSERVHIVHGRSPSPFIAELTTEPSEAELARVARRSETPGGPGTSSGAAPSTRPKSGPTSAGSSKPSAPKGPLTGDQVVAGPGLVLVDQNQEWVVEGVAEDDPGEVIAVRGAARRRFRFGTKAATAGRQRGILTPPAPDLPPLAPVVYDRLRQLRQELCGSKPAYTVFTDATLELIALAAPTTLHGLARVNGVGPAKLEQYGEQVLGVIGDVTG